MSTANSITETQPDVLLVGAGIMSATLAVILKELDPSLKIEIYEVLGEAAQESSNAWNNAGTGHAALCELNYTPQKADGSIDTKKALQINEAFKVSKQFWSYLVQRGGITAPQEFIQRCPHLSFVHGAKDVDFLRRRHTALTANHLFADMKFSTDRYELADWMPLVMDGREQTESVAA